jgi:hypothetical protein
MRFVEGRIDRTPEKSLMGLDRPCNSLTSRPEAIANKEKARRRPEKY